MAMAEEMVPHVPSKSIYTSGKPINKASVQGTTQVQFSIVDLLDGPEKINQYYQ